MSEQLAAGAPLAPEATEVSGAAAAFPASELPPGARRLVTVAGRQVVCLNVGGDYYAVGATCPHRGANLLGGTVCGTMLDSDPHEYRYGRDQQLLRCPWHGWQFDLRSGHVVGDERSGIHTYQVELVDEHVRVLAGR